MQQEFRSFSFGDIRNHTHTGHYVPQRVFYRRAQIARSLPSLFPVRSNNPWMASPK